MDIVDIAVSEIKPYPNNPRKHTQDEIDAMAFSMSRYGVRRALVVDSDNTIVVGHRQWMAAKKLGMPSLPCIRADDLSQELCNEYRLVDNQLSSMSEDDYERLSEELKKLDFGGYDFGFPDEDEREDTYEPTPVVEDDLPDAEEYTICKPGDIWQLGRHRLMCGDSTDAEAVKRLMDGHKGALLFTSPPYSDMRTYGGDKDVSVEHLAQFIDRYARYAPLLVVNLGIQRRDNEVFPYWDVYIEAAHRVGLKLLAWNVWDKLMAGSIGQQNAMIPIRHEWLFCFGREPIEVNKTWKKKEDSITDRKTRKVRQRDGSMKETSFGDGTGVYKKMESVLDIPERLESVTKQRSETGAIRAEHPATFPVALPAEYIAACTDKGDIVIEPFGGAGTTLIACEQLGRSAYVMELDAAYCDLIIRRWENFTEQEAIKVS